MKPTITSALLAMGLLYSAAAHAGEDEKAYQQAQAAKRVEDRKAARAVVAEQQDHLNAVGAFIRANPEVLRAYKASRAALKEGDLDKAQRAHGTFVGKFIAAARAEAAAKPSDHKLALNLRRMAYTVTDLNSPYKNAMNAGTLAEGRVAPPRPVVNAGTVAARLTTRTSPLGRR